MNQGSRSPRRHPSAPQAHCSQRDLRRHLEAFRRVLRLAHVQQALAATGVGFYERIFTPLVTLWYMVFQRLNADHTLQAAVIDLHAGGANSLGPRRRPRLSQRVRSWATTAYCKARERLPLALFPVVLAAQAQEIWNARKANGLWRGLRVLLLDGSQISLRSYPKILQRFTPSSNQHGQAYWVLMRVVVTFCQHSGLVIASALGSTHVSEQTLAGKLILQGLLDCLYLGDRNFGIFYMVQCVSQAHSHALFRLSQPRARKLAGSRRLLRRCGDIPRCWLPSPNDSQIPGSPLLSVPGRLLVAHYRRPGFRSLSLYLFTTLTDSSAFPFQALVDLYASRWQIELDLRHLKTDMELGHLDCKSPDMAEKEWMAGLLAHNLVRSLMLAAADCHNLPPSQLSFCSARRLLLRYLLPLHIRLPLLPWTDLLLAVASLPLPSRSKPRPSEPRAKRHRGESFPPLRGSRLLARKQLRHPLPKC